MREELVRRHYAESTILSYLRTVEDFRQYIQKRLDHPGLDEIRRYQVHLLEERKLGVGTVANHVAALRFLYVRVLKRRELKDDLPYPHCPKHKRRLPVILSQEEVSRLIDSAKNLFQHHSERVRIPRDAVRDPDSDLLRIHSFGHRPEAFPSGFRPILKFQSLWPGGCDVLLSVTSLLLPQKTQEQEPIVAVSPEQHARIKNECNLLHVRQQIDDRVVIETSGDTVYKQMLVITDELLGKPFFRRCDQSFKRRIRPMPLSFPLLTAFPSHPNSLRNATLHGVLDSPEPLYFAVVGVLSRKFDHAISCRVLEFEYESSFVLSGEDNRLIRRAGEDACPA
jgi:hypothetical protein